MIKSPPGPNCPHRMGVPVDEHDEPLYECNHCNCVFVIDEAVDAEGFCPECFMLDYHRVRERSGQSIGLSRYLAKQKPKGVEDEH